MVIHNDHLPTFGVDFKNEWRCTSTPPLLLWHALGNALQHNLHKYSLVFAGRNWFRQHSRGQSILRFNPLYICSRNLASFVRTVPKYLNFAVQADSSSYGLDIRQMMLFISCLQQSAPSDYFTWLAVCEPRERPQRRTALVVTQ